MGFLKHFRSRSKVQPKEQEDHTVYSNARPRGKDYSAVLNHPDFQEIRRRIFQFVCPHSNDRTFETSERTEVGDGCMLCDLRDLARCAQVRRDWYGIAVDQLYRSIRIDAVHYCALEEVLADQRRKKSKHGEPIDIPAIRLQLLCRTLRENRYLAATVSILKLPYMTRETCKADLARTVSVCPNLHYVDLPDGFFTGDQACHALRQELMARCPEIRKMKYDSGAEQYFDLLLNRHWQFIQELEISRLRIEPATLRRVLASLPILQNLKIVEFPALSDAIFQSTSTLPDFPPLHHLHLEEVRNISAAGIINYLSRPEVREVLTSLTLSGTGVSVADLHQITWNATSLTDLSITETVSTSLPIEPIPPLTSRTLSTIHFEITDNDSISQSALSKPSQSYYSYLTSSIMSGSLPALVHIYVCDVTFPDSLTMPPVPRFIHQDFDQLSLHNTGSNNAGKPPPRPLVQRPQGFTQTLQIYAKPLAEHDWLYTVIQPSSEPGRPSSRAGGRPLSQYIAMQGLGPQWGGDARDSVVVGNGFGGFLAVPKEEGSIRPRSRSGSMGSSGWPTVQSESARRASRHDLWR